jgi:hypothetical protein
VKGLMFNLLESMAAEAGCSDEAWELVIEFASADGIPGCGQAERTPLDDGQPARVFEVPAEAMLRCLAREGGPEAPSSQWDMFELATLNELDLETDSYLDFGGGYGGPPQKSPLGAFVDAEVRSAGPTELDSDGNPSLDEIYRLFGLGPIKQ